MQDLSSLDMVPQEKFGIKPVFSTKPLKSIFTGIVPKNLRFEITQSLFLSNMGFAVKKKSVTH